MKLPARLYEDYKTSETIDDGDIFLAICPYSWKKPKPFAIQLFSGENRDRRKLIYRVAIIPGDSLVSRSIDFGRDPQKSEDCDIVSREDRNMVVRIVKTAKIFKTFINGHYIQPTGACKIAQTEDVSITGASFNVWDLQVSASETVHIYRWGSGSSKLMGRIEALEIYMKNPVSSFWGIILEREEEEDYEGGDDDEIKATDEREDLAKLKQSLEEMAKYFKRLETSFSERERRLGVDEAENNAGTGTGTGGDGTDVPSASASTSAETSAQSPYSNSSRGLGVHPPDAECIKLYATIAWPRAVKHILGAVAFGDIQKRHEQLMSSWVTSRGDKISSEAYDYLMYSRWVGWPKVVLEASSEDELARVRVRCEEVMKVLD